MQKIPTLFFRSKENPKFVTREVNPDCQWVLDGEGIATRKMDGTCCAVFRGELYKRMDWDAGKGAAPLQWHHHDFNPAQRSGHGWYPVGDGPEDWMHRDAWTAHGEGLPDGTYELCGPKVNRNPEGLPNYWLIRHGHENYPDCPRDFDLLSAWLAGRDIEGIVWHHEDGRMAKIKLRDFGLQRKAVAR